MKRADGGVSVRSSHYQHRQPDGKLVIMRDIKRTLNDVDLVDFHDGDRVAIVLVSDLERLMRKAEGK